MGEKGRGGAGEGERGEKNGEIVLKRSHDKLYKQGHIKNTSIPHTT